MKTVNLFEYLSSNDYPGRGIAIGRTPCGRRMRVAYWIMGRSENSRNRIFTPIDGGIQTQAFDPSKLEDPSLIIYNPVRQFENKLIVTNGDQTDTIYDYLSQGKSFEDALRTRTFEPDGPNWTPRISALLEGADYTMSILRSAGGNPESTQRLFIDYENEEPGFGHLITTYQHNGNPLPSFDGDPIRWEMVHEKFDLFSEHIWESLNEENKISLFTAQITIETGEMSTMIFNKNN